MSGVRSGSRLDQLQALLVRTRHEIAAAVRREDGRELNRLSVLRRRIEEEIRAEGGKVPLSPRGLPRTKADKARRRSDDRTASRLEQLGVTAKDVKVWAVSVGLLAAVKQGRVKLALVEDYARAHPIGAH